jgi:hypothetical protein
MMMVDNEQQNGYSIGEKLCKHKYNSSPYCYDEIAGKASKLQTFCIINFMSKYEKNEFLQMSRVVTRKLSRRSH